MEINVFKKTRISKDGRSFDTYIGRLVKKSGEELTVQLKFKNTVDLPEEFPCTMVINKDNANLASRAYDKKIIYRDPETGEVDDYELVKATGYTLWVSKIDEVIPYVDHSLDDFED